MNLLVRNFEGTRLLNHRYTNHKKILTRYNYMKSDFLANIVFIFHTLIVIFVLTTPFLTNRLDILLLHIVFSISLLMHWGLNSNVCSLTLIESYLRNKPTEHTFSHRLISPVYTFNQTDLDGICYIIVIVTMIMSLFKFYTTWKKSGFKLPQLNFTMVG